MVFYPNATPSLWFVVEKGKRSFLGANLRFISVSKLQPIEFYKNRKNISETYLLIFFELAYVFWNTEYEFDVNFSKYLVCSKVATLLTYIMSIFPNKNCHVRKAIERLASSSRLASWRALRYQVWRKSTLRWDCSKENEFLTFSILYFVLILQILLSVLIYNILGFVEIIIEVSDFVW